MSELIAWARAYDLKMSAVRWELERQDAVYRQVLREESHELHDVDAERLRRWLFSRWMMRGTYRGGT